MNPVELMPMLALAFAAAALLVGLYDLRRGTTAWPRRFLIVAAGLTTLAFLYLLSRFIQADVSVEYVFLYTSTDLPLHWRIAGTWAGRQGSLLLWAMDLALVTAVLAWFWNRRPTDDPRVEKARAWTLLFLGGALTAFLVAVVQQETFRAAPDFFLQGRPGGNGLNPTLKSPFILIHPPIMFVAYALTTVPAAAALAHLATGTGAWSRVAATASRVDWLLYTFAMGLGGLWAYYTLGFGGYWAWDPVEVANLLPWLALTLYLHAQLHHSRYGSYATVGPFLAMLPFLLTVFSTISTRSGLWVSVHAFTDPTNTFNPDSPARFLDILEAEPSLSFFVALWLGTTALFLALWARRLAVEHRTFARGSMAAAAVFGAFAGFAMVAPTSALSLLFEFAHVISFGRTGTGLLVVAFASVVAAAAPALWSKEEEPGARRARRLDLRTLAYASVLILGLSLLLLFLFHVASSRGWSTGFYLDRLPWLATPAILGLLVLQGHRIYGPVRSLQVAALAWAIALIAALLFPEHRGGAYLTTLAFLLVAVSFDRVRRVGVPTGTPRRAMVADALLLAAALLNVAFWLNPPSRILGFIHVAWPIQVPMGAIALYGVWATHRIAIGVAPRRPLHVYLVVAVLGGYYVAPLLAVAAWILRRQPPTVARLGSWGASGRGRMREVALYGMHFAVAVALVGYAPSSHLASGVEQEVALGDSVPLAGYTLTYDGTEGTTEPGTPYWKDVNPQIDVSKGGRDVGHADGILTWEPSADAHFPLPATVRLWERDLFVSIDAVHTSAAACGGERWIEAYQATSPPRICAGDPIDAIRIDAVSLPALSLVWAALFLFVLYMAMLIAFERPRTVFSRAKAG